MTQESKAPAKNPVSLTLGIISTVVGVLALLVGWVPFLGIFTGKSAQAIAEPDELVVRRLEEVRQLLEEVRQLRRQDDEEQQRAAAEAAYTAEHLEVYDVRAKFTDSYLYGKVPGVRFKLRNTGEKELARVDVTVYFKDAVGTVIAEEVFYGFDKPLKPGYIWQMEQGSFYTVKSVPSEWQEGSVAAEVTGIRFSE